jgi:hypothetical protein
MIAALARPDARFETASQRCTVESAHRGGVAYHRQASQNASSPS